MLTSIIRIYFIIISTDAKNSPLISPVKAPIPFMRRQNKPRKNTCQSIDNNDAPSGLYKLQIALYQGEELTENEWIDTAITYQVVS